MSASREAISRASIRTRRPRRPAGAFPSATRPAAPPRASWPPPRGAARLAALENLRQPAAEHPAAPPELGQHRHLPSADGSTAPSSAGSASSRVARSLFFARVLADDANSRCDDRIRSEAVPLGLLGRRPEGAGHAERGARDYLGVDGVGLSDAGDIPRACFSAYPGR